MSQSHVSSTMNMNDGHGGRSSSVAIKSSENWPLITYYLHVEGLIFWVLVKIIIYDGGYMFNAE